MLEKFLNVMLAAIIALSLLVAILHGLDALVK
jgi:hypothetical protein